MTDSHDEAMEEFLEMHVLVDTYDDYEVASSWYSYLSRSLHFPFAARIRPGTRSHVITVLGLAHEDDCEEGILVKAKHEDGRLLDVPLEEIELIEPHEERERALCVWQYGVNHGYGYDLTSSEEE